MCAVGHTVANSNVLPDTRHETPRGRVGRKSRPPPSDSDSDSGGKDFDIPAANETAVRLANKPNDLLKYVKELNRSIKNAGAADTEASCSSIRLYDEDINTMCELYRARGYRVETTKLGPATRKDMVSAQKMIGSLH